MEHAGAKTLDKWYANRALPFPSNLHKLAVIAPDTSPGLAALRQRLGQRATHPLRCDHYAAGFNQAGSACLEQAFEKMRTQHAIEPYDLVLLLDGSVDALGIAESNGIIPGQVSRTPAPVWTAIGEDDANTELGDVANRVFASVSALIEALPLTGAAQPDIARPTVAANDTAAARQPAAEAHRLTVTHLPVLAAASKAMPAAAAGTHPLVLCAAGAVILASFTAIAAMLGWLPNQKQGAVTMPAHAVASTAPAAIPTATLAPTPTPTLTPAPTPAAMPAPAGLPPGQAPALAAPSEAAPEPAAAPASPQTRGNDTPDGAPLGAVAALGAAGLAAAPRKAESTPASKSRRLVRRAARPAPVQELPRQVGSNEVPIVEFVGTKTREQVIAEMMQARRAAARQAARGGPMALPESRILAN
ncbi:MAG: hypothetical protein ACJ8G3_18205 [Burkholderiaceae bacterium]